MTVATVPLGEVVDILSGFAFKSSRFGDAGDLPIVRIRDVVRGRSQTFYSGEYAQKFVVNDGDLLVGMDGEFNRARWSGGRALLNQRVCRLTPTNGRLDDSYLYHFLPAALKEIERETPFVTVKHLSAKQIRAIPILLPPIGEQRRIAAVLDAADALRTKRRQVLAKLDSLANSVFDEALDQLGPPLRLGGHLTFLTSGARGWAKHYADAGSRFVRSLDVRMNDIGEDEVVFVNAPETAEARRIRVSAGDVLLTITGSRIGRAAEAPAELEGSYVSQHVAIVRVDPSILVPAYLTMWLSHPAHGQRQIASQQYGQTKPGLNFDQIRSFGLPAPSLHAQQRVMRSVQHVRSIQRSARQSATTVDLLFASLQQRAFRGEL